jgi:hypothetical protein
MAGLHLASEDLREDEVEKAKFKEAQGLGLKTEELIERIRKEEMEARKGVSLVVVGTFVAEMSLT